MSSGSRLAIVKVMGKGDTVRQIGLRLRVGRLRTTIGGVGIAWVSVGLGSLSSTSWREDNIRKAFENVFRSGVCF